MVLNKKLDAESTRHSYSETSHMSFTDSILLGTRKNIYSLTCDYFEQQSNIQNESSDGKIVALGVGSNDGNGINSDNVQVYKFDSISL